MPPQPPPRERDCVPSAASSRPPSFRSTLTNTSMRRPPPALRTGAPRKAVAKSHVTLVFASGDAVPPNVPAGLRRAVSGASPSEEALSRQLDQDMAGERLGLRSRRSSAATIASLRTFSAAEVSHTVQEEDGEFDDRPTASNTATNTAGPSRLPDRGEHSSDTLKVPARAASSSTPSSAMTERDPASQSQSQSQSPSHSHLQSHPEPPSTPPRKVNPKSSGAWLRWNSPTPSFPKKGDKGKGKEMDSHHEQDSEASNSGIVTDTASTQRSDSPTPAGKAAKADVHTNGPTSMAPPSREPSSAHTDDDHDVNDVSGLLGRTSLNSSTTTHPVSSLTSSTASKPLPDSKPSSEPADVPQKEEAPPPRQTNPPKDDPPPPQPEQPKGWLEYVFGPKAPAPAAKPSNTSQAPAATSTPSRASTPTTTTNTNVATKKDNKTESVASTSSQRSVTAHGAAMNGNGNEPNAKRHKLDPEIASLAPSTTPTKACPTVSSTTAAKLMERESPAAASLKATSIRNGVQGNGKSQAAAQTAQTSQAMQVDPPSKASSTADSAPHTPVRRSTDSVREPESPADDPDLTPKAEPMHVAEVQGWGAYFTSFVFSSTTTTITPGKDKEQPERPKNTTGQSKDSNATIVETADPAADQKPLSAEEITGKPQERTATPPPTRHLPTPTPNQQALVLSNTSSPGSKNKLASSTSSTAGWLNYLAFRASQKKITGSTVGSEEPRVSGETAREEVMDFENDPNFPAAESPSKTVTEKAVVKKELPAPAKQQGAGARDKALTHKRSENLTQAQALALEARRQSSTSSSRSGVLANERPLAAAHNKNKSSSLPPPPQPPAKQPSLLIPSFETTFDRPPRSFLPRTNGGSMATATGVAWRALGAVSSYVYGEKHDPNEETRGKGAGRDVGADLPRRIGLGGGSRDDGWKNVRRVVVVGVHGWFPAKMLTSVIGEPTGTSVRFANMMGEAVRKFFREKNVDDSEIRLTLIPLEGEGTIENRVDKLYKAYLSNPAWINDLRRADAIFFAAHSQGCIVTTHLISRMIAQGHIRTAHNRDAVARCEWAFGPIAIVPSEDSKKGKQKLAHLTGAEGGRQKVAMLAMCGVHLGPFLHISTSSVIGPYLQWFENAAARELFEFQDTESPVSQAYQRALAMILENEVRILLLSSINDQVVPIYGASFSTATHPLLLRALFVDGASYSAEDFMTNLMCFAFMLRNAGIDDQGLVEHLSEATAGSLTGVGHSSPYDDIKGYSLLVHYLLHAGPAPSPLPPLKIEPFSAKDAKNDFELPWIMRALVDSPEVNDLFPHEVRQLKESIADWKPNTKALKEIKKRLEPMAGRKRRIVSGLSGTASGNSSTSSLPGLANEASASENGNGKKTTPKPQSKL